MAQDSGPNINCCFGLSIAGPVLDPEENSYDVLASMRGWFEAAPSFSKVSQERESRAWRC
jgi:hypothetical protein